MLWELFGRVVSSNIIIWKLLDLRINIKRARQLTQTLFSEKKKELLGWDSNPRHTTCQTDALTTELLRQPNGWVESKLYTKAV